MAKKWGLFCLVFLLAWGTHSWAYEASLQPFPDVAEGDWAEESIYFLTALGIVSGYPDKRFYPETALSREAFVKMLVSAAPAGEGGRPVNPDMPPLQDVPTDRWSYPYIQEAYQNRWIDFMVENGQFKPAQAITREEVAVVMGKYLLSRVVEAERTSWLDSGWKEAGENFSFPDQHLFSKENQPYLYFTVKNGIMQGDRLGFRPKDALSRKEAAAILYRLIQQETGRVPLHMTGFYAIRSYPNIDQMEKLDRVTFGWASLEYAGPGSAGVNLSQGLYRFPEGWEEVLARADQLQIEKELMVFADDANLTAFLRDPQAKESFIQSLLDILHDERYGFTGVCIDFEGLKSEAYRQDFAAFLRSLKERLGPGKTLTVAIPPNYYYKGYDEKAIGETADFVILMAYDFTDAKSLLPSAPLPLVRDALEKALQSIPPEKLILGISKQANQWVFSSGAAPQYFAPGIDRVEARLLQPGVAQEMRFPFFLRHISYQDGANHHEIWYEDTESIRYKIRLAQFYQLHGISLWHMGNFTEADWNMIGEYSR